MSTESFDTYTNPKTLLGSIGRNHRYIKALLQSKAKIIKKVQQIMDDKARSKTPFNKSQQRVFTEFTGVYAKEGGKLKKALKRIEHLQSILHNETEPAPLELSLLLMQRHQNSAITSLRRMIASATATLEEL